MAVQSIHLTDRWVEFRKKMIMRERAVNWSFGSLMLCDVIVLDVRS